MPIQRHIKNMVYKYTDVEKKVREATSNDPWGPSSTLMADITDKTHNVMAFTEIMQMIWRRLNDKSKNWRHVYKSLVLLDCLVKTGSEKVAIQCRENIHSIETLKEFKYFENGKDHGLNVRTKAQTLSLLLRDEERLQEERTKALLARERLAQGSLGITSSGLGSLSSSPRALSTTGYYETPLYNSRSPTHSVIPTVADLDSARPQSVGEEQLHLQLAIAISKEEHDREEKRRRADAAKEEAKLQMALEQSRKEEQEPELNVCATASRASATSSAPVGGLFNLVDTSLSVAPAHTADPWATTTVNEIVNDPFSPGLPTLTAKSIPIEDPWTTTNSISGQAPNAVFAANPVWPEQSSQPLFPSAQPSTSKSLNLNVSNHGDVAQMTGAPGPSAQENGTNNLTASRKRTPADFLGEHQGLVDLEKLIEINPASTNPFAVGTRTGLGPSVNPFLVSQPPKLSLNQLAPTLALTSTGRPSTVPSPVHLSNTSENSSSYYSPVHTNPWSSGHPMTSQNPTSLNPFY